MSSLNNKKSKSKGHQNSSLTDVHDMKINSSTKKTSIQIQDAVINNGHDNSN